MFDVIIVGSGASGTAAALRFADRGIKPCLLDIGMEPPQRKNELMNLYAYRSKKDCFTLMIGDDFEGLNNLNPQNKLLPCKLTTPQMRYVVERSEEYSPVEEKNFNLIQSFAQGGLASAWGAGVYRYTDRELEKFPIKEPDLNPYYQRLNQEMGISGENDDLTPYFGHDNDLQPPLKLSLNASLIMKKYQKRRLSLNQKGIFLGRPRLAVLSQEKNGRSSCRYLNLEFWQPELSSIYNPAFTLKKLIKQRKLIYKKGLLVKSWSEQKGKIAVHAERVETMEKETFYCKILVLAAGAANSARLILTKRKDYHTKLVLLDNPALQFPFFLPSRVGGRLEIDAFGLTQLNWIYDSNPYGLLQGSILELTSPARAEFFGNFPLAGRDNLKMIRYFLPSLVVMQLFLPAIRREGASLSLNRNGKLEIKNSSNHFPPGLIKKVIRIFRKMGAYSFYSVVVKVPPGHSLHYGGTLPMVYSPHNEYTCTPKGQLYGERRVFVVDGSIFPELGAKNSTFTIMANSMRIADHIVSWLRRHP